MWNLNLKTLTQSMKDQDVKILIAQGHYDEVQREIDGLEKDIEALFERAQAALLEIDTSKAQAQQLRDKIGEERSQIAVLENDIRHAQADIAALSEAVALGEEDSETSRQELENQTARIGEKQAALRKQQENFENKAAELTGLDDERERFSQQMQKLSEQVGQAHRDLSRTQLEEASSRSTMEELQARITNAALARKSKEEELEDTKRQEEDCQGV